MERPVGIMDETACRRTLTRIAHEIVERGGEPEDLRLVGILRRGAPLAKRIGALIGEICGVKIPVGTLDVTLYRDDLKELDGRAHVNGSDVPFSIENKNVVMVDDVIYTGRTARAAMDALTDMGRPARISLAVLIDRGHRELPIRADYVGKNLPTARDEIVRVRVTEYDGEDGVVLVKPERG